MQETGGRLGRVLKPKPLREKIEAAECEQEKTKQDQGT
jgi:hypothetical protein